MKNTEVELETTEGYRQLSDIKKFNQKLISETYIDR